MSEVNTKEQGAVSRLLPCAESGTNNKTPQLLIKSMAKLPIDRRRRGSEGYSASSLGGGSD